MSALDSKTKFFHAQEQALEAYMYVECSYLEALNSLEKLEAENAKLRDLVREMSLPYKYGECDCRLCPHVDECWDSETLEYNPDGCVILQMVRELGIEVD